MWFFDAAINHFDKDIWVLIELDHELLNFLHLSKSVFIHDMSIVEEQIVLGSQLNLYILNVIVIISL
jgi:hypothetical protein